MSGAVLVDRWDSSVSLFDLTDQSGASNPASVRASFGLGMALEFRPVFDTRRARTRHGILTPYSEPDFATVRWTQRLWHPSSYASLAEGVGYLERVFAEGSAAIKWTPDASTTRFIDLEPSDAPALWQGQRAGLRQILEKFDTADGVMLELIAQPTMRWAEISSATNLATNGTLILDHGQNGVPDGWTYSAGGSSSINADFDCFQFEHSATGAGYALFQDRAASAGQTYTVSLEGAVVSGPGRIYPRITFLDGGGGNLGITEGTYSSSAPRGDGRLNRGSVTATAPASTATVRFGIGINNSAASLAVYRANYVQLELASAATPFVNGSRAINADPATAPGFSFPIFIQGDADTDVALSLQIGTGSTPKVQRARIAAATNRGRVGDRALADLLNYTAWANAEATERGWTRSLGTDTTSVADANAAGGNAAEVASAGGSIGVMTRRSRLTRTTRLDSLRGEWDLWARVKGMTAASVHEAQGRWAGSASDPPPNSGPLYEHTAGSATVAYVWVPLGRVAISEDPRVSLAAVAAELWHRRVSGAGAFRADAVAFLSRDAQGVVAVPAGSSERWLGKDLITPSSPAGLIAGAVAGDVLRLNNATEAGGVAPATGGGVWPAGRHRIIFELEGRSSTAALDFTYRVRNVTDGTTPATVSVTNTDEFGLFILDFDSVAAKYYQPQVVFDGGGASDQLDIVSIEHQFLPYLAGNEILHTDPARWAAEKLDSSSAFVQNIALEDGQVPLRLPPGLSVITVLLEDVPQADYAEGESILARTATLSYTYVPRSYA